MSLVLVLNSGSSSIKFQLVDPDQHATDEPFASGLVEQIGEPMGRVTLKHAGEKHVVEAPIPDHTVGLDLAFKLMAEHECGPTDVELVAVGHRLVHGGLVFSKPELITDQIIDLARSLIPLAPLHNPANIDGIEVARKLLPDVPHVAVFDTGFFHGMPPAAALYAVDKELAAKTGVRRYGFHGTSFRFVAPEAARIIGKDVKDCRLVIAHLGNGASITAVKNGESQDTSMGFTPLEGLVMGTRSGDVDAGIYPFLAANAGMSVEEVSDLLNKKSGLLGISELSNDCRIVEEAAAEGHEGAKLAMAVTAYRLAKYIAAMAVAAGGIDALVFTGGIGENSNTVRAQTVAHLALLGLKLDEQANTDVRFGKEGIISPKGQTPAVVVVPTNEELMIAHDTAALSGL